MSFEVEDLYVSFGTFLLALLGVLLFGLILLYARKHAFYYRTLGEKVAAVFVWGILSGFGLLCFLAILQFLLQLFGLSLPDSLKPLFKLLFLNAYYFGI